LPASGKLGIGCVWISPGSKHPEQADLHLYVTTPDGQVIFDGNTGAKSGARHYFRDVRSAALAVDTNGVSSKSWEFVELRGMNEGDIGNLRCAVNVFHGSGESICGLFQVVYGQKKATQSFSFDTPTGNRGANREERPSPFWQDFDIKGLLHDATTAHR
jgi:hypothetical protein